MEFSSVSKNCLKEWYILRTIMFIFWGCLFGLIFLISTDNEAALVGKVVALIVVGMITAWFFVYAYIFPKIQYNRLKYRITSNRIEKQAGVIFLRSHFVPFVRIQHVEIYRGIFDRIFKMSTILIFTAGTMVRIQNLNIADAENIVVHIRKLLENEALGDVND